MSNNGMIKKILEKGFGIKDKVYGAYLTKLDPRNNEHVRLALGRSKDPRFLEFLERISLPQYNRVSLQTIAKACSIDLQEFNNWWLKESTQAAIAVAQNSSIKITEDIAQDALSRDRACERCDGLGWVSAPAGLPLDTPGYRIVNAGDGDSGPMYARDCPNGCNKGKLRKPGDAHARDVILAMSGLVTKQGGPSVTVNLGTVSHASALSTLHDAMTIDVDGPPVDSEKPPEV